MTIPIWLRATWTWLVKYWKWLILPVGVLLFLAGKLTSKKQVTITSTALAEADEAKRHIDEEADAKVHQADAAEAGKLAGIGAEQAAATASATQSQLDAAKAAQGDSDKVNALLHDVGEEMRR